MTETYKPASFFDRLKPLRNAIVWLLNRFRRIYFLRFPLLTALALILLPVISLCTGLSELLASLFVTNSLGIFMISAAAFTTAWAVLITYLLIRSYGNRRFGTGDGTAETFPESRDDSPAFSIGLRHLLLAAVTAVPVVGVAVYKTVGEASPSERWKILLWLLLMAIAGLLISLILLYLALAVQMLGNSKKRAEKLADNIFSAQSSSWVKGKLVELDPAQRPRKWLNGVLRKFLGEGKGYFDEKEESYFAGHGLAAALFGISLLAFVAAGLLTERLTGIDMPALFFVVLLLMLLCWGLSGLSFWLDRYRVPVLLALLGIAIVTSPNYYYSVESDKKLESLTPDIVIKGGVNSRRIIVVAAEGGGIQAAAWTARVLTGLQSQFRDQGFAKAVRVVSSVSGGSVGALFFVNGYNPQTGAPDDEALGLILDMAEGNSLDDVAQGLVYHDFIHTFIPFWEVGDDRGTALEKSLAVNCQKACDQFSIKNPGKACPVNCSMKGTLAGWANDVRMGMRPANIFNATVVESGDRLLVANTDVEKPIDRGRKNFAHLLGGKDIQAATSARLSAAFPYVSPTARSNADNTKGALQHVADGGYYDNYGMTSLVEWLNDALGKDLLDSVLVIQIQNFDDGLQCKESAPQPETAPQNAVAEPPDKKKDSGYVSQFLSPLLTLLHIRTAAQASHKEIEYDLLREKFGFKRAAPGKPEEPGKIKNALFKFRCGPAPLTWKLTREEKERIAKCWEDQYVNGTCNDLKVVGQFLEEMKQPANPGATAVSTSAQSK